MADQEQRTRINWSRVGLALTVVITVAWIGTFLVCMMPVHPPREVGEITAVDQDLHMWWGVMQRTTQRNGGIVPRFNSATLNRSVVKELAIDNDREEKVLLLCTKRPWGYRVPDSTADKKIGSLPSETVLIETYPKTKPSPVLTGIRISGSVSGPP